MSGRGQGSVSLPSTSRQPWGPSLAAGLLDVSTSGESAAGDGAGRSLPGPCVLREGGPIAFFFVCYEGDREDAK